MKNASGHLPALLFCSVSRPKGFIVPFLKVEISFKLCESVKECRKPESYGLHIHFSALLLLF